MEKTRGVCVALNRCKKHLHARGENVDRVVLPPRVEETPPRTWRKLICVVLSRSNIGNTSTHVEKTVQKRLRANVREKHLHARGENGGGSMPFITKLETPPRTWRKPLLSLTA